MRIYLASVEFKTTNQEIVEQIETNPKTISVLGSYYTIRAKNPKQYNRLIPNFKDFILDSGAFSFMNNQIEDVNWDKYLEEYAGYIIETRTEKYFELDIDLLVGYEKVKEYRSRLEALTGIPSIPVWHRSRGREEFLRLCDEYPYVAVGGIAIKHIKSTEYWIFESLIRSAHKRTCKIHGLGFTNQKYLRKYHFDSVDSSSWSYGGRRGHYYKYRHGLMQLFKRKAEKRVSDFDGLDAHNFGEWVKYQSYAEEYL